MSRLIVGVDAGGTCVSARTEPGDRMLVHLEGANALTVGVEKAAGAIATVVETVCGGASPAAIAAGVAGAGRDGVAGALEAALRARFSESKVRVVDDVTIALRGGAPSGDGIVLICGTGSIAHAVVDGKSYRAGGYGHLLGDEGSGFAIGSAALRLMLRAFEGRAPRDEFVEALRAHLGVENATDVVTRVYDDPNPVAVVASIAAIAIASAGNGERSANKIVQAAALELFELVRAVWRLAGAPDREMPLVFGGGVLSRENNVLSYLLETRVHNELPALQIVKFSDPIEGALAIARELASA
jgi:glucosamine kinase